MENVICHISHKAVSLENAHRGSALRTPLFRLIQKEYPNFGEDSFVSNEQLKRFRNQYLTELVQERNPKLDTSEKEVVEAISDYKILSENIEDDIEDQLTFGQRIADKIAVFGGSWTFILAFFSFIVVWIAGNVWFLVEKPFDPYPFILLNLMLSCLAAIQAPIIMMSQNRQGEKDRMRSEHDYKINLKAELEIKILHEKMDYLISYHNEQTIEIRDMIQELKDRWKST